MAQSANQTGTGSLKGFAPFNTDFYEHFDAVRFMEPRRVELSDQSEDGFTMTSYRTLRAPPGELVEMMRAEVEGEGLVFEAGRLVGGTITGFTLFDPSGTKLATLSGLELAFSGWTGFSTQLRDATSEFIGSSGRDVYLGGSGDDRMVGGAGDDFLDGGEGNDRLLGGTGNDTIVLGPGSDSAFGGAGNDTFVMSFADGEDFIGGGAGRDTLDFSFDFEAGTGGTLVIDMSEGTASMDWAASFLEFRSIEVVNGAAHLENNIVGSKRADIINGGQLDDHLCGGRGNDVLNGGGGNDVLTGGQGKDKFAFSNNFGNDTIVDFETGRDKLDFSKSWFINDMRDLEISGSEDGTLISTDQGTIWLAGIEASAVEADSFLF